MKYLFLLFPLLSWGTSELRLSQGIKFKTISNELIRLGKPFDSYLKFLEQTYPLTFQKLKIKPINRSLLLTWPGKNQFHYLFNAHYDVVPVEEKDLGKWTHPPYSGKIDQSFIWGRGTMDDKIGVQASLEAIENLLKKDFQPRSTLHFAITQDEELGGWQGAAQIASEIKRQEIQIDAVFDEGLLVIEDAVAGFEKPIAIIGIGEKGYATVKLSVFKKGGHSSMPAEETAYTILNKALSQLKKPLFKRSLIPPMETFLETLGNHKDGLFGFLLRHSKFFASLLINELKKSPPSDALLRTTQAVTVVKAGIKENKIPNTAEALINFRLLQGDTVKDVLKKIKERITDKRVKIELINLKDSVNPSPLADTSTDAFHKMKLTIEEVYPDTIVASNVMIARTDSYHYQKLTPNIYRFLPLRIKKSDLSRIHGLNERVSIENYKKAIKYYQLLMEKL